MSDPKDSVDDNAPANAAEAPPATDLAKAAERTEPVTDAGTQPDEPPPALESEANTGEAPRKKKKKKRRKTVEADVEGAVAERPATAPDGSERPRFLLRFPEDPELEALIRAFEAGDYARVRRDAPALIARAERPDIQRAAKELLRRTEPDPLVKFILLVSAGLFLAIVAYVYYVHG